MRIGVVVLDIEGIGTVLALHGRPPKRLDNPMKYVDPSYHDRMFSKR